MQTKASDSIFLEPVAPEKRIIFVSIRNTSDKDLTIKSRIVERLISSGYTITDYADRAHFMLQAYVLKVGRDTQDRADSYIEAGFSGAVLGDAVSSHSDRGKGVVLGALIGVVADSMVDDTLYTMVTDLQVRERQGATKSLSSSKASKIHRVAAHL